MLVLFLCLLPMQRGESKDADIGAADDDVLDDGMESLALINWYREGQKKGLVRSVLAASLTTQYRLHFSFAQPLFWEVNVAFLDARCALRAGGTE